MRQCRLNYFYYYYYYYYAVLLAYYYYYYAVLLAYYYYAVLLSYGGVQFSYNYSIPYLTHLIPISLLPLVTEIRVPYWTKSSK